jgi:hypothetical protein
MKSWLRTSSPLRARGDRVVTYAGLHAAFGEITDEVDEAGEDAQDHLALERWLDDGGAVPIGDESR